MEEYLIFPPSLLLDINEACFINQRLTCCVHSLYSGRTNRFITRTGVHYQLCHDVLAQPSQMFEACNSQDKGFFVVVFFFPDTNSWPVKS